MANKKLRTLATLTSALLVVNAGVGAFSALAVEKNPTAVAAQSDENIEYGITMIKAPTQVYYSIGEELSFTDGVVSCYSNTYDKNGKLIDNEEYFNKSLQELVEEGIVSVDDGGLCTSRMSGTYIVTLSFGDASTTYNVFLENPDEKCTFTITTPPKKTLYNVGEGMDLTGAKFSGYYTDGINKVEYNDKDVSEAIEEGILLYDEFGSSTFWETGEQVYYLNYLKDFSSVILEIPVMVTDEREGYSIYISTQPDKRYYNIGEELDLTGAKFSGFAYQTGVTGDWFGCDILEYAERGLIEIDDSEFDSSKAGTYTITIYYTGMSSTYEGEVSASFDVTVMDESTEYSLIIDDTMLIDEGIKYVTIGFLPYGEILQNVKVSCKCVSGEYESRIQGTLYELVDVNAVEVDYTNLYNAEKTGYYDVVVTYGPVKESFSVYVIVADEDSAQIELIKEPDKTEYTYYESLDFTGGIVELRYSDGKKEYCEQGDLKKYIEAELVGYDAIDFYSKNTEENKPGMRTVKVNFGADQTSFEVYATTTSLEWESLPEKTEHILGEKLDLTGGVISSYYTDGKNDYMFSDIDLQELIDRGEIVQDDTLSQLDENSMSGTYNISFYYHDKSINYDVYVINPNYEYLIHSLTPAKLSYNIGEELDLTGTKISAAYGNMGEKSDIFNEELTKYIDNGMMTIDASEFDSTKEGEYTINVRFGTAVESFTVFVEDMPFPSDDVQGDANGDGKFTIADMVKVQSFIMGDSKSSLKSWESADLCKDGKIDVFDFIVMRKKIVERMK